MPLRFVLLLALSLAFASACDDDGGDEAPTARPNALQTLAAGGETGTFTSGIAAGDVRADSAILWTRADGADSVLAEYSTYADLPGQSLTVSTSTAPGLDYTVKVRIGSLQPATTYYYRFRSGSAVTATGTFTTAPLPGAPAPFRFVYSGDSDGSRDEEGEPPYNEFEVLTKAQDEDPDFFLYFGDTIYGDREPSATTLDEYRGKYKENRNYKALADILAATSTYNVWDDHEVVNDFAGATVDRARFDAGLRAFTDYMPIDENGPLPESIMTRSFRWGAAAEFIMVDARSFRSASAAGACTAVGTPDPVPAAAAPGAPAELAAIRDFVDLPPLPEGCLATIDDPARTMLGPEQLQYLKTQLKASDATWKFVVTSVPVQQMFALPYDRWEGYAAERRDLLEYIRDEGIKNVVFLATDMHATIFGPVRIDPSTDEAPVAYEAVTGPIAANTLENDVKAALGDEAGGLFGSFLTGVAKVECANLDSYSYGLVDVDPATGTLTITSKDEAGAELCKKELKAE